MGWLTLADRMQKLHFEVSDFAYSVLNGEWLSNLTSSGTATAANANRIPTVELSKHKADIDAHLQSSAQYLSLARSLLSSPVAFVGIPLMSGLVVRHGAKKAAQTMLYLVLTRISLLRVLRAIITLIGVSVATRLVVPAAIGDSGDAKKAASSGGKGKSGGLATAAAAELEELLNAGSLARVVTHHTPLIANDFMGVMRAYWALGSRVLTLTRQTLPLLTSYSPSTASAPAAAPASKAAAGGGGASVADDLLSTANKFVQLLQRVTST